MCGRDSRDGRAEQAAPWECIYIGDGERRAPGLGGGRGVEKGGVALDEGNELPRIAARAPRHFLAAPNGAAFSSNSSITVPGSDSSVRATVMRWPSDVRTLAMRRGCQSVCPSICRMVEISSTTAW